MQDVITRVRVGVLFTALSSIDFALNLPVTISSTPNTLSLFFLYIAIIEYSIYWRLTWYE
jgi:hypothetical protein